MARNQASSSGTSRALTIYAFLLVIFLLSPIVLVIPVSFNSGPSFDFPPDGFSLRWYENLFQTPEFLRAFLTSLRVTAIAITVSLIVGGMVSYALVRHPFFGSGALASLLLSPLLFPQVVLGIAMIIFLSSIGLIRSITGLAIAYVVVTLPYITRTLTAALLNLDPRVEEVAVVLGANRLKTLWLVVVPNLRTALLASVVLAGLVAFDEFTIALFVTGGDTVTLPVQIYLSTYFGIDPTVAALGTLLIIFSTVVVFALERTIGMERVLGLPALASDNARDQGPK